MAWGRDRGSVAAFGLAVAVLGINDHGLKGAGLLAGWVTGKLSDFSGLIVASTLIALALKRGRVAPDVAAWLACGSIGAGFAALKLSATAAAEYDAVLTRAAAVLGGGVVAHTAVDPTDLLALVVLPVAFVLDARSPSFGTARRAQDKDVVGGPHLRPFRRPEPQDSSEVLRRGRGTWMWNVDVDGVCAVSSLGVHVHDYVPRPRCGENLCGILRPEPPFWASDRSSHGTCLPAR